MRPTHCVHCQNVLTMTIVYVDSDKNPVMWKTVEPWYLTSPNEYPSKLKCTDCGLLYDHEEYT